MEHRCLAPWKGAGVGGLIVFVWSAVSWMVLPFHNKSINFFTDSALVVHALENAAPSSGIYLIPNDAKGQSAPTDPFVFVSYHKEGWGSMGRSMALGLLIDMIGAFFWTWILGKIPGLTLKDAALYGLFLGWPLASWAACLTGPGGNFLSGLRFFTLWIPPSPGLWPVWPFPAVMPPPALSLFWKMLDGEVLGVLSNTFNGLFVDFQAAI